MLILRNISKSFDGLQAVLNFSILLESRKITSLIGPNGAGKTTIFNIITGFLEPDTGGVFYKNALLLNLSPWKVARIGISRTFQNLRLFRNLSVLQNVLLGRRGQAGENFFKAIFAFSAISQEHKSHTKKAESLLEFVGLTDHRTELVENLSYGQQKLLSIACCLAADPELLLLDEPVSGVQPMMIEKIQSILKELVENQGKTVFIIEHDIDFVLKISDNIVVMDEGKKIAEGKPADIRNDPEILEAYLS